LTDAAPSRFPSTRADALRRLESFTPRIAAYEASRNHVVPGHSNVSCLSPAVRQRLVLEEELVDHAIRSHGLPSCAKFVEEVLWRTYWKGWLEQRPGVWHDHRRRVQSLREGGNRGMLKRVEQVARGESGVAVMDAFARELLDTGFMHNHARMWWASFWIHVERLPWDLGADHFLRHLLDGDPASNTLSWRWVAGLHTPGKTYLARRSNIERYVDRALLTDVTGMERLDDARVTAATLVDDANPARVPPEPLATRVVPSDRRIGLWLHDDDLLPEVSELASCRPVAVGGWLVPDDGSDLREAHRLRALRDGLSRASSHFGCVAEGVDAAFTTDAVRAWANRHRLDEVVAFAPFVGPVRDASASMKEATGVPITLVRRAWDRALLPFATGGFFGFREKAMAWVAGRPSA
jgi:deoxyribodipyrimidine photo-lyase